MECHQSGLFDYQWCQNQGINPESFYNWVSKLRKSGYTFPESTSRGCGVPVKQEVVKLDLADHETPGPVMAEQSVSDPVSSAVPCIAAEIECGNIMVRFFHRADAAVVQNTLKCIGKIGSYWSLAPPPATEYQWRVEFAIKQEFCNDASTLT